MSGGPDDPDDPRLLSIAKAIVDGSSVAWDQESTTVPRVEADVLGMLRAVERIVVAHRQVGSAEDNALLPVPSADAAHPTRWRDLAIRDEIGRGSFGVVYKAHYERLGIDVALKLTPLTPEPTAARVSLVLGEARRLAKVRHSNVVRIYGADHVGGRVGMWMELIAGRTLEEVLNTQGTSSPREAALVGLDLSRALAAVHHVGLVHGDVKAANVMREQGGRIVLMDFGAAHDVSVARRGENTLHGTPAYVAPEVFGGEEPSRLSDIYAVGVLLFHLVTREYPVWAKAAIELPQMHLRGERRQLRDVRPDLPEEYVRVVDRALAPRPSDRYRSAGELESALARFIDPSPPPATPEKGPRLRRSATIAAGLGALALGGWLLQSAAREKQPQAGRIATGGEVAERPVTGAPYEVDAAFYRSNGTVDERLGPGHRLAPGDRLSFALETSVPAYLYIVNEPEQGKPILLFPLPGRSRIKPLPASARVRIPESVDWQVTSTGGREHFVVFVSPERVDAFEPAFDALSSPKLGEPVTSTPMPGAVLERLRGVGGLVPNADASSDRPRFSSLFTTPLSGRRETAHGLWIRQLVLDNPSPSR